MSVHARTVVIWGARILGLAAAAFLGLLALDAFDNGLSAAALAGFGVHLMPALAVGLVAGVGWRYPWLGAVGFGALAAGYALLVPYRPDWILVISGPLALVAVLFALGAMPARGRIA
jgi:hypothetical protein